MDWDLQSDGTLTYTITSDMLADILSLTEFELDTKADYDAYDAALTNGQITLTISDGKNASTITSE